MKAPKGLALAALVIVSLAAGVWVARVAQAPKPVELQGGVLLPVARPIAAFTLTDQDGKPFTNAELTGHWSLLFAGFTHCPDVCPTTLVMLKQLREHLKGRAPAMLFLSVDPERDTPAVLKPYVRYFSPSITGLSSTPEQLQRLAESLGVAYVKIPGAAPGEYTMDHSAALVLIDPQGCVAGYFPPPHKVDTLAADLDRATAS